MKHVGTRFVGSLKWNDVYCGDNNKSLCDMNICFERITIKNNTMKTSTYSRVPVTRLGLKVASPSEIIHT